VSRCSTESHILGGLLGSAWKTPVWVAVATIQPCDSGCVGKAYTSVQKFCHYELGSIRAFDRSEF